MWCWIRTASLAVIVLLSGDVSAKTFDFDAVNKRAQALAKRPYQERSSVPNWLLEISYDQWRDIRFRPEHALWQKRNLPFQVQFFHPGLFYNRIVAIHVIDAEGVHRVAFSPDQFDYGKNDFASRVPQNLGYAGFRLHYPIKTSAYRDEVIVFLGASYLRAVGRDQVFGLSARGLGIDTASETGEEFPYFREFWLVRPTPEAPDIGVYALLDSPRLTGAYHFVIRPGVKTLVQVDMRIFRRQAVEKLCIAPLTSMFFFGENSPEYVEDFRPEVHDSDGLLLAAENGEWLWRPLQNHRRLHVSTFELRSPKGFGLLQRNRNFDHYQDLETRPDLRPSTWITPRGDWGTGHVELVEIPSKSEQNDNIVAFWVPKELPPVEEPVSFAYELSWYGEDGSRPPAGRVLATRRDRGTLEDAYRFVVDFAGGRLNELPEESVLRGVVSFGTNAAEAELLEQHVVKNPVTGGFRLTFQVRPHANEPLEMRAFLQHGSDALTETWSYVLLP